MIGTRSKIMRTVIVNAIVVLLSVSGSAAGLPKPAPSEASVSLPAELQGVLTDY
jgi:hypothetical protein